jgi:hypothetical protein
MRYLVVFVVVAVVMACVPAEALRTVETEQLIYITPDGDEMEWNGTYNASSSDAQALSNYNVSAVPFMNSSNVSGTFTGPFTPPMFYKVANETAWTNDRVTTIVRFKSEEVMSGSSVSWWRLPALELKNPVDEWLVTMRLWHVDSPGLVDDTIVEDLLDNEPNMARTSLIFTRVYGDPAVYGGGENVTYRWQNFTAGDPWEYSESGTNLTFLWLRVDAMVHADASYLVDWEVWSETATLEGVGKRLMFTGCDVGDNGIYKTWLKFNSTAVLVGCDLDVSVVHQFGIGHSVSGWPVVPPAAGGGGGSDVWGDPDDEDMITESTHPTGTDHDGDWTASVGTTATTGTDPHAGSLSVYDGTVLPLNGYLLYTYDTAWDVTVWDTMTVWVKPYAGIDSVTIYVYDSDSHGYYKLFVVDDTAWNEIVIDLDSWGGWTTVMTPDLTIHKRLYIMNSDATSNYILVDHIYFEVAGGGSSYSTLWCYDTLEEPPDEVGDYLTFFMPFMYPLDNSTNALVEIETVNGTWSESFWVAENGPCDFAIKSWAWGHGWSSETFSVNVTFYNASNAIWVHDDNADYNPWYGAGTPHGNNYFIATESSTMLLYGTVWYRPYHSLQVTDGEWVNTLVPDDIIFGGRYVNMSDLQMRNESYTPPLWLQILEGYFAVYNFIDKFIFLDMLPNLDAEHFLDWFSRGYANIKGTYWLINAKIGEFVEAVVVYLEYAGHILAGVARGVILFLSILVFVAVCLYSNGVKNFFVIGAKYGTVEMGDYAIGFLKRSFSIASFGRWG